MQNATTTAILLDQFHQKIAIINNDNDNETLSSESTIGGGDNILIYQEERILCELCAISSPFPNSSTDWGPKRDPLSIVVPITVVYVLTFVCGVVGNISTCIVIARNKSMHTATNYYLFSLAISDLLLLISGLPPEIYSIWSKYPYIFGDAFCVLQGFAAETSANATVLTITAFTIERYVAICHPFLSHTLSKLNRAIKFVVMIWMVAMCLAVPQAMAFGVVYEETSDGEIVNEDHCVCMVKRLVIPHAFEISTFVFFVAPMSLITVLYVLIGVQLHRSTVRPSRGNSVKLKHRVRQKGVTIGGSPASYKIGGVGVGVTAAAAAMNGGETSEKIGGALQTEDEGRKNFSKNAQATRHVVKMLIAVVVAFFICWAPFHAQRLLAIYGKRTSATTIAFQTLTYISGVFYYLSTTVNPLLYHIMSHKFREAFKGTYKQLCFRRGRLRRRLHRHHNCTRGGRCYSTLSARSSQVNSHSNTDSYSYKGIGNIAQQQQQQQQQQSSSSPMQTEQQHLQISSSSTSSSTNNNNNNNNNNNTSSSSLRYLDAEMARLYNSRRPLVVSFRRKAAPVVAAEVVRHYQNNKNNNNSTVGTGTNNNSSNNNNARCIGTGSGNDDDEEHDFEQFGSHQHQEIMMGAGAGVVGYGGPHGDAAGVGEGVGASLFRYEGNLREVLGLDLSVPMKVSSSPCTTENHHTAEENEFRIGAYRDFVEVHSLQPTHICPLLKVVEQISSTTSCYPKLEAGDQQVLDQEATVDHAKFCMTGPRKNGSARTVERAPELSYSSCRNCKSLTGEENSLLIKSCTMPEMRSVPPPNSLSLYPDMKFH